MAKNSTKPAKPEGSGLNFLVDRGYAEGETFCRELLDRDDFSATMLRQVLGQKKLSRRELATEIASRIVNRRLDPNKLMLAYCKQPRTWLCVRFGSRGQHWETANTGYDFLTKMSKKSGLVWYGPFGDGDEERWYVVTTIVDYWLPGHDNVPTAYPMRWQVAVQVRRDYVALHWNNSSTKDKASAKKAVPFAYWDYINDIFKDLSDMLYGEWDPRSPNLMDLILYTVFDRYTDSKAHSWENKAVSSSYDNVALNASGMAKKDMPDGKKEERAAKGLQILTRKMAETVAPEFGMAGDQAAIDRADRAILRMILRKWGTKSYEFALDLREPAKAIARMRVYFGSRTARGGRERQETIQHVHAYASYGGSTAALNFILSEMPAQYPAQHQDEEPGFDPFDMEPPDEEPIEDEADSFEDDEPAYDDDEPDYTEEPDYDDDESEQPEYDPDED